MADEINVENKVYISSKRAAKEGKYSQDYIGQLARAGKIDARRVGGLWFVYQPSLDGHKKGAEEYKPVVPNVPPKKDAKALVSFDGKEYISALRASELTGYNQDYVGQLARSGKILSRQVGNRWYVENESLIAHKKEKDALLADVQVLSVGLPAKVSMSGDVPRVESSSDQLMTYKVEHQDLMPQLHETPTDEPDVHTSDSVQPKEKNEEMEVGMPVAIRRAPPENAQAAPVRRAEIATYKKPEKTIYRAINIKPVIGIFAGIVLLIGLGMIGWQLSRSSGAADASVSGTNASWYAKAVKLGESYLSPELIYTRQ